MDGTVLEFYLAEKFSGGSGHSTKICSGLRACAAGAGGEQWIALVVQAENLAIALLGWCANLSKILFRLHVRLVRT
jgi:hypothetical protein